MDIENIETKNEPEASSFLDVPDKVSSNTYQASQQFRANLGFFSRWGACLSGASPKRPLCAFCAFALHSGHDFPERVVSIDIGSRISLFFLILTGRTPLVSLAINGGLFRSFHFITPSETLDQTLKKYEPLETAGDADAIIPETTSGEPSPLPEKAEKPLKRILPFISIALKPRYELRSAGRMHFFSSAH